MQQYFPHQIDGRKKYCNPFRSDSKKGCYFNTSHRGNLIFFDNAYPDKGGNCFDVCMLANNCNFPEALKIINRDFNLNLDSDGSVSNNGYRERELIETKPLRRSEFKIKAKPWQKTDVKYWGQFNIDRNILSHFDVLTASEVSYMTNKDNSFRPYHKWEVKDPMYIYKFMSPEKILSVKVYRPKAEDTKDKWRTNASNNFWELQGWKQLPEKGDLLIITSSLKDVMCLYSFGYTAIAPHSEGILIQEDLIEILKRRFKRIVLFFDCDDSGIRNSIKYEEVYEFEFVTTPSKEYKDISDYCSMKGNEETIKLLKELLGHE